MHANVRLQKAAMTSNHSLANPASTDAVRAAFATAFSRELSLSGAGVTPQAALRAAATATREVLAQRWGQTQLDDAQRGKNAPVRRVHYLSMEFRMGRALSNALAALGLADDLRQLLAGQGLQYSDVLEREPDMALGNGGLGRLAACFLDSFAELGLPSFGYGMRYQYGMFAQGIQQGMQIEMPDDWMRLGQPWEVPRTELRYSVGFGGRVAVEGGVRRWRPSEKLEAQAYDFIVPAHHSDRVSTLRQWHASAEAPIDFAAFCEGDLERAARHRVAADALNWVLYPDDSTEAGRELRLKQEAFLVSASPGRVLSEQETFALIFEPGFSTAEQVTNLSGRGVGMDVVKRNITALRGTVSVASQAGVGTTVSVRLPLTLAIINGFQIAVGNAVFVIPLEMVDECIEFSSEDGRDFTNLRGQVLPFLRLREFFALGGQPGPRENVVVIRNGTQRVGLVVDRLLGEAQTVIKPLSRLFDEATGISGSSIQGNGEVALILDMPALMRRVMAERQLLEV